MFESEWKDKWVPATMKYCRKSKKKEVKDLLAQFEEGIDDGKDTIVADFFFNF